MVQNSASNDEYAKQVLKCIDGIDEIASSSKELGFWRARKVRQYVSEIRYLSEGANYGIGRDLGEIKKEADDIIEHGWNEFNKKIETLNAKMLAFEEATKKPYRYFMYTVGAMSSAIAMMGLFVAANRNSKDTQDKIAAVDNSEKQAGWSVLKDDESTFWRDYVVKKDSPLKAAVQSVNGYSK